MYDYSSSLAWSDWSSAYWLGGAAPAIEEGQSKQNDNIDRREFLAAIGGAAAVAAQLTNLAAAPPAGPTQFIDSFGNVSQLADDVVNTGLLPPTAIPPAAPGTQQGAPAGNETLQPYTQPNMLLIMVDQMRYPTWFPGGQTGPLYATFPNIATSIRSNAIEFSNYYPAATNCTPSRATLLTGLYSQQQFMFEGCSQDNGYALNTGFYNIGSALSESAGCPPWLTPAGRQKYDTAWIGKWHLSNFDTDANGHLGPDDGPLINYGFTSQFSVPNPNATPPIASPIGWPNEGTEGGSFAAPWGSEIYESDRQIELAFEAWAADKAGTLQTQPWFCGLSFVNPHDIAFAPYAYGLTSGNFIPPPNPGNQAPVYYQSPPVGGDTFKQIPALFPSSIFGTNNLPQGAGGTTPWNGNDPAALIGFSQQGKPDLQLISRNLTYKLNGAVVPYAVNPTSWQNGWNTFLNYYYWMHTCVDKQVGNALSAVSAAGLSTNTWIIFLSDHGEHGGSHDLQQKGATVYDESIRVPLYIVPPTGQQYRLRSQMVSSVDVLPFILTLACGSPYYWHQAGLPFTYLAGRESIYDYIYGQTTGFRRTVTIGATTLQYVLHTYDELSTQAGAAIDVSYASQIPPPPSHVIGMRTQTVDSGGNYSGGKIAKYSFWGTCSTMATQSQEQYEFYDYQPSTGPGPTPGNIAENGNDYFTSPRYAAFKAAFDAALPGELYAALPGSLASVQCAAKLLYLQTYQSSSCTTC